MNIPVYFEAVQAIIRTGHLITDQVSAELKALDITEPQFNVLRILRGQKGRAISVQEIQKRMVQRSSNVTRIIDRLLIKGLVARQECPSNRRKMDITITPMGLELLPQLDKKVELMHQPIFDKLSDEELKTITLLLNKLKEELK